MAVIRFVGVGHVCHDVAPGGYILGGAAAYSGIAARNLGAQVRLITSYGDDFNPTPPLPTEFDVFRVPATETTTFDNRYDAQGHRTQWLLGVAATLGANEMPDNLGEPEIVYLCPLADEVKPDAVMKLRGGLVGATPQGWLRQWDDSRLVRAKRMDHAEAILPHVNALVLSDEDIAPFPDELTRYVALAERVILTHGRKGATLYEEGRSKAFAAYEANEADPTGAGDVFAAAFLIRFSQTGLAGESMDYANCVASFAVEGAGTTGVPTPEQIEQRWKKGRRFDG